MVVIMKRTVVFFCILVLIMCSCTFDPYSGRRPSDYGNAKWVCEELNAWFAVDLSQEDDGDPKGELELDGNRYPIKLYFIHQTNQVFLVVMKSNLIDENTDMGELWGECSFSKEKLIIHINDPERDTLFDGKYESLSFYRKELDAE